MTALPHVQALYVVSSPLSLYKVSFLPFHYLLSSVMSPFVNTLCTLSIILSLPHLHLVYYTISLPFPLYEATLSPSLSLPKLHLLYNYCLIPLSRAISSFLAPFIPHLSIFLYIQLTSFLLSCKLSPAPSPSYLICHMIPVQYVIFL